MKELLMSRIDVDEVLDKELSSSLWFGSWEELNL